ncbi:MAG: hypothetical protein WCX96_03590 [Bacilli bacterium]
MERSITLGGNEIKLRSSLFTIISYRSVFGTELFSDVKKLDGLNAKSEEEVSVLIDTIFKITYILHKPFTSKSYDEFLNEFDFSIISEIKELENLAKVIGELLGSVKKPMSTP